MMLPDPAQVRHLLYVCDLHQRWQALADEAFRRGFAAGYQAGHGAGYHQAEADRAAQWKEFTEPLIHPGRFADQRIRGAEAFTRAEAREHEAAFLGRAQNTPARYRTATQRAAVWLASKQT